MFSCNTDITKTSHIFQSCKQGSKKVKKIGDYLYHYDYQIGSGTYSQVYEGVSLINDKPIAVKVIDLQLVKQKRLIDLLYQQTQLMSDLHHPNVIECYALLKSQNRCYIITQLCKKDNLQDLVQKAKNKRLPISQVQRIIYDIYQGLNYLSQKAIIHRDLKTANILFSQSGKAKIADFGFATHGLNQFQDNVFVGTPLYMSPEAILQQKYSSKTDIWSFGIIIYQLMFGQAPMSNCRNQDQLLSMIVKPVKMPKNQVLSSNLVQLLEGCLETNSINRWNIDKVGKSAYIQNLKKKYHIQTNIFEPLKIKPQQIKIQQNNNQNQNNIVNVKQFSSLELKSNNSGEYISTASTNIQEQNSRVYPNVIKGTISPNLSNNSNNHNSNMVNQQGLNIQIKNPSNVGQHNSQTNSPNNQILNSKSILGLQQQKNLNPNHYSSITYSSANTYGTGGQVAKKPSSGRCISNNSDINSRYIYNNPNNVIQVNQNINYNNGMNSRYAYNTVINANGPNIKIQRHSLNGAQSRINLVKFMQNNYVSNQKNELSQTMYNPQANVQVPYGNVVASNQHSIPQPTNANTNLRNNPHNIQSRVNRQLSLKQQQISLIQSQQGYQIMQNNYQIQGRKSQLPSPINLIRKTQSDQPSYYIQPNHVVERRSQLSPLTKIINLRSINLPNPVTVNNNNNNNSNFNNNTNTNKNKNTNTNTNTNTNNSNNTNNINNSNSNTNINAKTNAPKTTNANIDVNNEKLRKPPSFSLFATRQLTYKQAVSLVHYCRLLHKIMQFPRYFNWYLRQWLLFVVKDLKQNAQVNSLKPEHTTSLKNVLQGYYNQYVSENHDSKNNNSEAIPQIKSVIKILKSLLQIDSKNGDQSLQKELLSSLIQQTQSLQKCLISNQNQFQNFAKQTKCQIYLDMFNKNSQDSKIKIGC